MEGRRPMPLIDAELKRSIPGDVVWADVVPGQETALMAIVPWSEPQHGKLMRVGPADVDGQRGFAAEIATESKPVTAFIPMTLQNGKRAPDARLLDRSPEGRQRHRSPLPNPRRRRQNLAAGNRTASQERSAHRPAPG